MTGLLLFSVFVVATCGLIYELIAGALASYLLGDSVTQFSTVIGSYLFSMGIGSYLSRFIKHQQLKTFIQVELLVGVLGGASAAILFFAFAYASSFQIVLYALVSMIGILVGLEIPLLMQILRDKLTFSDLVSKVLSFDYIGALAASILFPLFFVPHFGLIRTGFFFGILNVLVALWVTFRLGARESWAQPIKILGVCILIGLGVGFSLSDKILDSAESYYYPEKVVFSKNSSYQRIVLTRRDAAVRLYLNSNLQFDSSDEYRYHEALVHLGLASLTENSAKPLHVLILGGGDGLAVREALKYEQIASITLVDLDPEMTHIFRESPLLRRLNQNSLDSSKVTVINEDAFVWIRAAERQFDFIIVDLPDPTSYSLGKLYTSAFYRFVKASLNTDGLIVVQSTSPLLARKSFWCVEQSLREAGLHTLPYHAFVPSFGEWGFVLAGNTSPKLATRYLPGLRFVSSELVPSLIFFPNDMDRVPVDSNRLNNQALVRYYEEEWSNVS